MPLCVRLAPELLEARENPSLPVLDPFGGPAPVPVSAPEPVASAPQPAECAPSGFWAQTATAVAAGPLLADNSLYNVPLVWPALPR